MWLPAFDVAGLFLKVCHAVGVLSVRTAADAEKLIEALQVTQKLLVFPHKEHVHNVRHEEAETLPPVHSTVEEGEVDAKHTCAIEEAIAHLCAPVESEAARAGKAACPDDDDNVKYGGTNDGANAELTATQERKASAGP